MSADVFHWLVKYFPPLIGLKPTVNAAGPPEPFPRLAVPLRMKMPSGPTAASKSRSVPLTSAVSASVLSSSI